jgi:Rieske Fe-S protein
MNLETTTPDGRSPEAQPTWRKEYPLDWPESEYVSRREFTRLLVLTSFAFVVGQSWVVASSLLRRATNQPPVMDIAAANQLPIGGSLVFTYPHENSPCVLVRLSDDKFVAYGQRCTHLSCPVIPKPQEGRFHCPCHEGAFDLQTGAPLAGPPRRPLPRVTLEVRNGRVIATGIEEGVL